MRLWFGLVVALLVGCQRTPEQKQQDKVWSDAQNQASVIQNRADNEADRLQQQSDQIGNQANAAGGYTGKRLEVRAEALSKEGKIVRQQGDLQADAVKEAADARIKASKSR